MLEAAAGLLEWGQQVLEQQRTETGSVCFVSIAPFLLGAGAVGLRGFYRGLRRRRSAGGQQA